MAQDTIPSFVLDTEQQIKLFIAPTQAQVAEQRFTYNQPGFTYNQPGWQYGGVYLVNQDLAPVFFNNTVTLLAPSIASIIDLDRENVPPNNQRVIGPGWWMYVSQ
jgi:hypothetical protein